MKRSTKILTGTLLLGVVLGVALIVLLQDSSSEKQPTNTPTSGTQTAAQVDASDAIIDQAIEQKKPELCEDVTETTRPGPDDGPIKVTGNEAVNWCKEQVEAGQRIYGG